jgi:two-component system chemotaxis sensor kinase CheA
MTAPERRVVLSIGTRLAFATALLVLVVAGAVQYALMRYLQHEQLRAKRDAATMVAALFAELSSAPVLFSDEQGIHESLGYLRSTPDVLEAAVFATRADGNVAEPLGTLPLTSSRQSTLQAPSRAIVGTLQQVRDTLDVSHWIREPSGKHIGVVLIRFSLAREQRSAALLEQRMWQISLGLAGVLTVALLLLAQIYIIRPLQSVHAAVRELSTGGPSAPARKRLPLAARDEVGDLARGFLTMAEAIERREAAIADQNRQMRLVLESVGEGFLVLDAHGSIEGQHSAVLETWFGAMPHGQTLWDYLRSHDPGQAEWLELTWANIGAPFMPLELCLEQMPREWSAGDHQYSVDYRPLTEASQLVKMVVIVSDVTELRKHAQAENEQRELVSVFATLMGDRTGFVSFCEDAKLLIDHMAAPVQPASYDLTEHLHTITGNAFLFRLREFGDACEQLETLCSNEGRSPRPGDAARLAQAFSNSVRPVEQFIALDRSHNVQLSQHDYDAIVQSLQAHEAAPQVLSRLQLATAVPAELVFGRFSEQLHLLARRLGKCAMQIQCVGDGVRFPRETFASLWSVIVHVLRNIADHGLETAWEREQAKKSQQAHVLISAEIEQSTLVIRFRDDGRGVDWQRVRERAERRGLTVATRADLTAALLGQGFSTLDETSALSGRGVGLAALQHEVAALGGTIRMESELGHGTELTIVLPASLVLAR